MLVLRPEFRSSFLYRKHCIRRALLQCPFLSICVLAMPAATCSFPLLLTCWQSFIALSYFRHGAIYCLWIIWHFPLHWDRSHQSHLFLCFFVFSFISETMLLRFAGRIISCLVVCAVELKQALPELWVIEVLCPSWTRPPPRFSSFVSQSFERALVVWPTSGNWELLSPQCSGQIVFSTLWSRTQELVSHLVLPWVHCHLGRWHERNLPLLPILWISLSRAHSVAGERVGLLLFISWVFAAFMWCCWIDGSENECLAHFPGF